MSNDNKFIKRYLDYYFYENNKDKSDPRRFQKTFYAV